MKRMMILACGLVSLAASAAVTKDGAAVPKLSAAQIVERNVAARGGLPAWRAVSTLTLAGKLEAGSEKNPELPFVLKLKRQHLSRMELQFQGQTALQVFDGAHGWKLRPFLGRQDVEPFTPAEAKSATDWQELDGPLIDYARKGSSVALDGMEDVEGHHAYKLKLTLKDGSSRHVWIDAESFLERKMEGDPRVLDGKPRNVTIYYRDYRAEHGLMLPHTLETFAETAKRPYKMTIDEVTINQPMQDTLFAKPQLAVAKAATK